MKIKASNESLIFILIFILVEKFWYISIDHLKCVLDFKAEKTCGNRIQKIVPTYLDQEYK